MSNRHRTTPPLSVVFSPDDITAIRAELAEHEAVMLDRMEAVYGPAAVWGPLPTEHTGNVIDIFTGKVIR